MHLGEATNEHVRLGDMLPCKQALVEARGGEFAATNDGLRTARAGWSVGGPVEATGMTVIEGEGTNCLDPVRATGSLCAVPETSSIRPELCCNVREVVGPSRAVATGSFIDVAGFGGRRVAGFTRPSDCIRGDPS